MHPALPNPTRRSRRSRLIATVLAICAGVAATLIPSVPATAQGAGSFVFTGAGWGHGVGMSQNGARNMADAGFDHNGILNHYYPNTIVTAVPTLEQIRVHIGDASRVELSSAGAIIFERNGVAINSIPSGTISISAHDGGLQIGNAWTTGSPTDPLFVTFPMPVKISNNGHSYLWGKLQLTNRNGKVRVVEVLSLEEYVAGISEMPAAWPLEALMAQAIAARTYAHEVSVFRRNSGEWAQEYDISGTTVDQNYIGWDAQDSAWDQKWLAAVKATAGVEIVDNNGPIRAYYSATNGGYTETAAYVFGNDVPYTVAGPDQFDAGGHNWSEWSRTYSQGSMSRWLNASANTAVGTVQSIEVLGGEGASARIDKAVVEIKGTGGTKRVTGKALMLAINAGVFGEGGGLGEHLPGTFTTIGNGASAGAPKPGGVVIPAPVTPDPIPEGEAEGPFVPPPGWTPEPGTGVPPGTPVAPGADDPATTTAPPATGYVPPPGWTPEPGTGVPPISTGGQPGDPDDGNGTNEGSPGFVPPPGWTPEPGTGVPPGQPVAPGNASSGSGSGETGSGSTGFVPPPGWAPEPGTGVPPGTPAQPAGTGSASLTPGLATADFVPPPGWRPEPGTGVSPVESGSLASTVLLISRTDQTDGGEPATFEVISQPDALADEARARLHELQLQAAIGLFAGLDIDGYLADDAAEPVNGVCATTESGVACLSLSAYRALMSLQ